MNGVQVMVFIVTAVVLPLVLAEFGEWCPWLAERMVRWAAHRLGDPAHCARYEEEWTANLRELPGKLSRLVVALGLVAAIPKMWWTLRISAVGLGWLLPWRAYQLARERLRFQTVVAHVSDVVMVLSPDASIRYVSPVVERAFGYAPSELLGVRLDDLAHPDDRAALLGYLYTASRQPTADAVEWRWRDREGVWRYVETVGTNLVHMPDVAGVVLSTRDVSERKALEQERIRLLGKTIQVAEEERIRIAGDLHDGPIQQLTTMGYGLDNARRKLNASWES